jgi:hypothetical protein
MLRSYWLGFISPEFAVIESYRKQRKTVASIWLIGVSILIVSFA